MSRDNKEKLAIDKSKQLVYNKSEVIKMFELMELFNGYNRIWYSAEKRKLLIAQNMRLLRKESGISQKQLSEMLGVSPQAYNGYETGKYEPNIEILIRLCFLYNVDMDYMTSRWNGVDDEREAENLIENERDNNKFETISLEIYEMEQQLEKFKKEFLDMQKRAKTKKKNK